MTGFTTGGKSHLRDVKRSGESNEGIRNLAEILGWEDDLEESFANGTKDSEAKEHLRTASNHYLIHLQKQRRRKASSKGSGERNWSNR